MSASAITEPTESRSERSLKDTVYCMEYIPIEDNARGTHCGNRNVISPVPQRQINGRDLKRHHESLVDEEVPADHKAESVVDPVPREADEASRDRMQDGHLGDTVIDAAEHEAVYNIRDEQAGGAASSQAVSDGDEQGSADGAADGYELDVFILEAALEAVDLVDLAMGGAGVEGYTGGFLLQGLHCWVGCYRFELLGVDCSGTDTDRVLLLAGHPECTRRLADCVGRVDCRELAGSGRRNGRLGLA